MRFDSRQLVAPYAVAALALTAGCDEFLDVSNPNNLEVETIDSERDRTLLSQSVYQDLVAQLGTLNVYSAWFTNEARVGDTFPTRNEFGRRDVQPTNNTYDDFWNDLHSTIQFANRTIASISEVGNTLDLARVWFTAGVGILVQAELFCEGTLAADRLTAQGPMTSEMLLDSAIHRLTEAATVANAVGGDDAANMAMATNVLIARAHLQANRPEQAVQFAAQVPSDFVFDFLHLDDASNRRLGNDVWSFSEARISLVVGPEWRAMADAGDPRIAYVDMERVAQDGVLNFFRQDKFEGWADPDRVASGLEARYIEIEVNANPADMLAFINERRAVGGQEPVNTSDMDVLLDELFEQRSRDFWLEGRRIPDFRRQGEHVPYVIPPGDNYYKPELGLVNDQVCWPVPDDEYDNNPLWPQTGG